MSAVIKPGTVRFCVIDSQGAMQYCKLGAVCQIVVFVTAWQVPQSASVASMFISFNGYMYLILNEEFSLYNFYIKEPQSVPIKDIILWRPKYF